MKCNAVFEGGGVRGIGHVGAAFSVERAGYTFENVAGCSAGAIIAALIAVGYNSSEMKDIIGNLDYLKFKQKDFLAFCGPLGKFINLHRHLGLYKTDYFTQWIFKLLKRKNKTVFGDIKNHNFTDNSCKYKLQVMVSDITTQLPLTLPQDLSLFGINPDTFSIAQAVRMSMSIPFFYRPYILKDNNNLEHFIVDGGLLSNYPLYLLDSRQSNYATFGFKFVEKNLKITSDDNSLLNANLLNYIKLVTTTALDGHDNQYISKSKGDLQRTIAIPVTINIDGKEKYINSTYFSITKEESNLLFKNGELASKEFLTNWDYNVWKNKYSQ